MGKSTISMAIFNSYAKLPESIPIVVSPTIYIYSVICPDSHDG